MRDTENAVAVFPSQKGPAPWDTHTPGSNGVTAFTRGQAQRFARNILESQAYRDSITKRATNGTLAAGVEQMLWHYAYGKPIEQVNVTLQQGVEDLSGLSISELQDALRKMEGQLAEAQALEDAIPASFKVGP